MTEVEDCQLTQGLKSFYLGNVVVLESERSQADQGGESSYAGDGIVIEPQCDKPMVLGQCLGVYLHEALVLQIQLIVELWGTKKSLLLTEVPECAVTHDWVASLVVVDAVGFAHGVHLQSLYHT